ncbi:unnamed protein product [Acanthosepion pharaonis]|uniref:Uncharacterized protein n=1 Tax=Acanthosepion pharaonis TaxID=158019 RepID=A0A812CQ86_ACAPH|nr:unnamed protein product [Sepia pharaonis]
MFPILYFLSLHSVPVLLFYIPTAPGLACPPITFLLLLLLSYHLSCFPFSLSIYQTSSSPSFGCLILLQIFSSYFYFAFFSTFNHSVYLFFHILLFFEPFYFSFTPLSFLSLHFPFSPLFRYNFLCHFIPPICTVFPLLFISLIVIFSSVISSHFLHPISFIIYLETFLFHFCFITSSLFSVVFVSLIFYFSWIFSPHLYILDLILLPSSFLLLNFLIHSSHPHRYVPL